jgi:hypothetical protein
VSRSKFFVSFFLLRWKLSFQQTDLISFAKSILIFLSFYITMVTKKRCLFNEIDFAMWVYKFVTHRLAFRDICFTWLFKFGKMSTQPSKAIPSIPIYFPLYSHKAQSTNPIIIFKIYIYRSPQSHHPRKFCFTKFYFLWNTREMPLKIGPQNTMNFLWRIFPWFMRFEGHC